MKNSMRLEKTRPAMEMRSEMGSAVSGFDLGELSTYGMRPASIQLHDRFHHLSANQRSFAH